MLCYSSSLPSTPCTVQQRGVPPLFEGFEACLLTTKRQRCALVPVWSHPSQQTGVDALARVSGCSNCSVFFLRRCYKTCEAVSMRFEVILRGRSEYHITNTDMVHLP
jgi:hypothetical protein